MKLPRKLHVIGICGVATSALAIAFHRQGVSVSGSDKGFYPPVSTELEKQGVKFYAGWHPENMFEGEFSKEDSIVIVGTASGSTNPELAFAKENDLQIYSFPEAIGKFFTNKRNIVCAGTWGKTSSSALLSFIFEKANLNPSYMFGGVSLSHDSSAKISDSDFSIFEGDEYKSSPTDLRAKFFHYQATDLLLTAVSWDHADLYPTEQKYFEAFTQLIQSLPNDGIIATCNDRNENSQIIKDYKGKIVYYGRELPIKDTNPDYFYYKNVTQTKDGLDFTIIHNKKEYKIHSPMIGLYQAENLTGCFAMAFSYNIAPDTIISAISHFRGLKRRMEKRLDGAISIIDDIAHSPEKARSVCATLRSIYHGRVITVFEPNTGGRSRESQEKYDNAFEYSDTVIIPRLTKLKINENAELQPMEGLELSQIIGKTHKQTIYLDNDEQVVEYLTKNSQAGDVIAFLGSHGFRGIIEEAVKRIDK